MKETQTDSLDILLRNIVYIREINGLTKAEMANKLNISITGLNKIERGEMPKRMGVETLIYIKKNFGISPSDMFSEIQLNERKKQF